jgi:hypothetical protein
MMTGFLTGPKTFKEFPPSQKAASFNLSQVMEKLSEGGGGSK